MKKRENRERMRDWRKIPENRDHERALRHLGEMLREEPDSEHIRSLYMNERIRKPKP